MRHLLLSVLNVYAYMLPWCGLQDLAAPWIRHMCVVAGDSVVDREEATARAQSARVLSAYLEMRRLDAALRAKQQVCHSSSSTNRHALREFPWATMAVPEEQEGCVLCRASLTPEGHCPLHLAGAGVP